MNVPCPQLPLMRRSEALPAREPGIGTWRIGVGKGAAAMSSAPTLDRVAGMPVGHHRRCDQVRETKIPIVGAHRACATASGDCTGENRSAKVPCRIRSSATQSAWPTSIGAASSTNLGCLPWSAHDIRGLPQSLEQMPDLAAVLASTLDCHALHGSHEIQSHPRHAWFLAKCQYLRLRCDVPAATGFLRNARRGIDASALRTLEELTK